LVPSIRIEQQDPALPKTAMPKTIFSAATAVIALLAAGSPRAGEGTSKLAVQATLVDTCLVTATPMSFPSYTAGAGPVYATATLNVRCTNGAQYAVGLSAGSTAGASFAQRLLADGASTLQYNLYLQSNHTSIWGDGSAGTSIIVGNSTGFGTPVPLTVYGEVPDTAANQAAGPGVYTDTILVVLTY